MAREVELKFEAPAVFRMPDLTDAEAGIAACVPGEVRELSATYADTADLRLAREGVTLRYRTGEDPPRWTLKLPVPGAASSEREEVDVPVPDGPDPDGTVPAELLDLLTAWLRGAAVAPVTTLRTVRTPWLLAGAGGEELAEVVDDVVTVLDGERVTASFREIEVELAGLDAVGQDAVCRRLVAAGAVAGEFVPKAARALGARAAEPPDAPVPGPVRRSGPAGAVVTAAVRSGVRRLFAHDAGVRRDAEDAVHQMRVACRRLRSDLRTFGPLVDAAWADGLREELAWLAGELGAVRDLEVLAARIARTAGEDADHPVPPADVNRLVGVARERRVAAMAHALAALRSERYVVLLDRLVAAAREPVLTAAAGSPAKDALPPLVAAAWRRLAKRAGRLRRTSPADEFHAVRILAKRARYAAEACAPALGARAARTAAAARAAQEVLGESNDGVVAAAFVLDVAAGAAEDGPFCVTAGRIAEREYVDARAARERFLDLWPRVGAPKKHRWLDV